MVISKGQQVKIKTYTQRPLRWNRLGKMDKWMGKIVTIDDPIRITIKEDDGRWIWKSDDFEIDFLLRYEIFPDNLFEI